MNDTYTIYIENVADKVKREIKVEDTSPMDAHKTAYMKVARYEEINKITNSNGDTVFELDKGFKKQY